MFLPGLHLPPAKETTRDDRDDQPELYTQLLVLLKLLVDTSLHANDMALGEWKYGYFHLDLPFLLVYDDHDHHCHYQCYYSADSRQQHFIL